MDTRPRRPPIVTGTGPRADPFWAMGPRHGKHAVRALAALVAAATLALLAPAGPATASAATTCNLVAATNGSDSNPGTAAQPLRSPGRLAAALAPGQTGCLREGTYSWSGDLSIRTASITLTSFGEEQAVMQGRVRIEATATGAVLEGLVLDGRNSGNELSPLIYASQVVLRDNEITNHHTGICIHLDRYYDNPVPTNVVIEGNRIHDCGALPANNFDHGIYVGKAEGTVIRDNWIYDNANRGIQLYSQAQHTQITGNVIDGNGQGVIFGGEQSNPSSNNVVEGNVISNSRLRDNVESSWGGSPGTGNVVRGNCIGGGTYDEGDGGILSAPNRGFAENGNTIAEPEFVNRSAGDLSLVPGSVCDQLLNGGAPAAQARRGHARGRQGRARRRPATDPQGRRARGADGAADDPPDRQVAPARERRRARRARPLPRPRPRPPLRPRPVQGRGDRGEGLEAGPGRGPPAQALSAARRR